MTRISTRCLAGSPHKRGSSRLPSRSWHRSASRGPPALFLAEDAGDDSAAARSAIEAAREIRDSATALRDSVRVKVGVHWGATLMVGQVSTHGRLDVTALGDEMNEAARIENAAHGGIVLASKKCHRTAQRPRRAFTGGGSGHPTYRTIAELTTNEKAVRDAGSIALPNSRVLAARPYHRHARHVVWRTIDSPSLLSPLMRTIGPMETPDRSAS